MKIIPQDCRKRRKRREGKDRKALGAEEKMATEDSRKEDWEKKIAKKDCIYSLDVISYKIHAKERTIYGLNWK